MAGRLENARLTGKKKVDCLIAVVSLVFDNLVICPRSVRSTTTFNGCGTDRSFLGRLEVIDRCM